MTRTPNTVMSANEKAVARQMEEFARVATESGANDIAQELRGFVAAIQYKDKFLKWSSAKKTVDAIRDFLDEYIEKEIGTAQSFRKVADAFFSVLRGKAIGHIGHFADLDKLGKMALDALDRKLKEWSDATQAAQLLLVSGFGIQNGPKLQQETESTREVRKMIAENWPWAYFKNQEPVDKEMVARSRKAFLNKECESIEQAIERLGGSVTIQDDSQG